MRCCSCRRLTLLLISILITIFIIITNEEDEFDFYHSPSSQDDDDIYSNDVDLDRSLRGHQDIPLDEEEKKQHDKLQHKIEDDYEVNNPNEEEIENHHESGIRIINDQTNGFQATESTNADYEFDPNGPIIKLSDVKGIYTSLFHTQKASNNGGTVIIAQDPAGPQMGGGTVNDEIERLTSYLEGEKLKCPSIRFIGSANNSTGEFRDGAYHVCQQEPYWIPPEKRNFPCLGYSFGIDYEWSFDDALAHDFGCEVHSFDPGMYDEPMHFTRKDSIFFHRMGIDSENSDSKYHRAMRDYSYRKKYGDEKLEELRWLSIFDPVDSQ